MTLVNQSTVLFCVLSYNLSHFIKENDWKISIQNLWAHFILLTSLSKFRKNQTHRNFRITYHRRFFAKSIDKIHSSSYWIHFLRIWNIGVFLASDRNSIWKEKVPLDQFGHLRFNRTRTNKNVAGLTLFSAIGWLL